MPNLGPVPWTCTYPGILKIKVTEQNAHVTAAPAG